MTVTAHYVDEHLKLHARILTTVQVPESHTAEHLKIRLENIAASWNITEKIVYVVSDNGSNIVNAVRQLTEKFRDKGKNPNL